MLAFGILILEAPAAPATLSLTTSAAPTFSVTLSGSDQAPSYSLPMSAGDTTDLTGWHLTITSTSFSTGGTTPRTLGDGASQVTAVSQACAVPPCVAPLDSVALPVTVPAAGSPPAPASFFDAAAATGTGQFTITATVAVSIPAKAYAGSYASTVTVGIVSGP